MDNIEQVTLENAADQLKAKIRMAFVELIPEDQWKRMVMAELTSFTKSHSKPEYAGSTRHVLVPSEFSSICSEVFADHLRKEVKAVISSPEWNAGWGNDGREKISIAVKSWLTENSVALIQSTVEALAQRAALQLVSSLRSQ